ncbi:hypothetical protein AURDEDRAFT_130076 [Auricularia subglabra TFB-10046 SS5]|uniref:Uncharacterized protein n=1 Tax=Auricularia subglabra (strain TFB-10046 / SS5) TaxID=717982 RepID=J0D9E7_AURST|nr:hypothetical protein AURDEDRAFT_130076 [Auricularia subglabra TFB-10046 SS5]
MSNSRASSNAGPPGRPLEPPPDCYAAHLDEFPKPGSRILGPRDALAAALLYNAMDPDVGKELENLRNDKRRKFCSSTHIVSRQIHARQRVSELTKQVFTAERRTEPQSHGRPATDPPSNEAPSAERTAGQRAVADVRRDMGASEAALANHAAMAVELQDMIGALDKALNERTVYKAQLKKSEQSVNALSAECQTVKGSLARVRDDLTTLESERSADKAKIGDLKTELQKALAANQASHSYASQCNELKSQNDLLSNELRNQGRLINIEISGLTRDRDALQRRLDEQSVRMAALKTGRALLCQEIRGLMADQEHLRNELGVVSKERDSLEAEREIQADAQVQAEERDRQLREITDERDRLYCYLVAAHELEQLANEMVKTDNLKESVRAANEERDRLRHSQQSLDESILNGGQ